MFSNTVMRGKIEVIWKLRDRPSRLISCGARPAVDLPLTVMVPALIGQQKANLMFLTGRRIGGEQAVEWGLADVLAPLADVRKEAIKLAQEIAEGAPLAVMSTRETMRRGFADGAEAATERELTEQEWTRKTEDFKEGVKSYAEKRPGNWKNR